MTSENSEHKPKIGIVLINLGTPSGLDIPSIRQYLSQFLSDRRVIDLSRFIWYPLLYGIILRRRPAKTAKAYARIWDYQRDESPLRIITREQAEKLARFFHMQKNDHIIVDWAMRYGEPAIETVISHLIDQGCERLLCVPLYPQYCAATTATVCDEIFDALKKKRYMPSVRIASPYYTHPLYIDGLARSIKQHLHELEFQPEHLILSYHGIPQRYVKLGDPYYRHCLETSRLLEKKLNKPDGFLLTTFQSRFGREPWLQPYTDETLRKLGQAGIKSVSVICPGFSADCIETIDEINFEGRETFFDAGGENFSYIPCLNASPEGMHFLNTFIMEECAGWDLNLSSDVKYHEYG